jgi:hypothetical protein
MINLIQKIKVRKTNDNVKKINIKKITYFLEVTLIQILIYQMI